MNHSRGHVLILLVAIISVAAMVLAYGSTTELGRAIRSEAKTRAALEYARQALIGRAIADASRPGSLPCPDTDDDGSAELFVGSACPSYIGRLPWRTLGIGDVRDASGERLWYALSPPFRDHPSAPALNSDTRGTLTLYSGVETTVLTREAVALVFAPGPALGPQLRDTSPILCAANGRHVARMQCASNYLDRAAGFDNGSAAGPYVTVSSGDSFNDRVAMIVTADFMPLVEQRVALELRNALLAYRKSSPCGCYPWAAGTADASEPGLNRGRVPTTGAGPSAWPPGVLPAYFHANRWNRIIHYAVGRDALENRGGGCATCRQPLLTLDGAGALEVVLLTPGYAERVRQSAADYFDDADNRDGDDAYVTPRSVAASRNRVYAIARLP